jgi:hypothetical protein
MNSIIEQIQILTYVDITERTRKREVVELRSVYFTIMKAIKPNYTLAKLGDTLQLDHATVIHSLSNFDNYISYNPKLQDVFNVLLEDNSIEIDDNTDNPESKIKLLKDKIEKLNNSNALLKAKNDRLINDNRLHPVAYKINQLLLNSENKELIKERLNAFLKMNK